MPQDAAREAALTEPEKRRQRQVEAYERASDYDKAILDCQWWLTVEADLETSQGKRLGQQMRNKFFKGGPQ